VVVTPVTHAGVTLTVQPVTVDRETAAGMLGVSLAHFERHIQAELRLVRSGRLRLVPVKELQTWAEKRAHAVLADD
jgi:excisionase family DNA binding protein